MLCIALYVYLILCSSLPYRCGRFLEGNQCPFPPGKFPWFQYVCPRSLLVVRRRRLMMETAVSWTRRGLYVFPNLPSPHTHYPPGQREDIMYSLNLTKYSSPPPFHTILDKYSLTLTKYSPLHPTPSSTLSWAKKSLILDQVFLPSLPAYKDRNIIMLPLIQAQSG